MDSSLTKVNSCSWSRRGIRHFACDHFLFFTFCVFFCATDDRDESQDVDLVDEHKFKSYAPIVSFYAAAPDRFTDIPFPSSEDWEAACGKVFAHTFMHSKNKAGEIEMNGSPRYVFMLCGPIIGCVAVAVADFHLDAFTVTCLQRRTSENLSDRGTTAALPPHSFEELQRE